MKKNYYLVLEGYGDIQKFKTGCYDLDLNKLFTNKKDAIKHFNKIKKENKQNDCFYKYDYNIHVTQLAKETLEGDSLEEIKKDPEGANLLDYEVLEEYIENKNGKMTL